MNILRTRLRNTSFVVALTLLGALGLSGTAHALDGCKVLLCLASPGGPKQFAECVPTINDLFKSLAKGHPFPSCKMAGDPNLGTGSFARPMPPTYYDQCPAGSTTLPSGSYAIMAPNWIPNNNDELWVKQQQLHNGIGEGDELTFLHQLFSAPLPPKVCVSGLLGEVSAGPNGNANVYSSVTLLQPQPSTNLINVYVDGALSTQVRW